MNMKDLENKTVSIMFDNLQIDPPYKPDKIVIQKMGLFNAKEMKNTDGVIEESMVPEQSVLKIAQHQAKFDLFDN
jgi:hypothetical protein